MIRAFWFSCCLLVSTQALAQGWFADLGGGIGLSQSISSRYHDAIGADYTLNRHLGDDVLPHGVTRSNTSPAAAASVGRFLTDSIYVKGSYRYFGGFRNSGSATYVQPTPNAPTQTFQQAQYSTAHGAFVGVGETYDLAPRLYLDVSAEIGAAMVHSDGVHDVNLHSDMFPGSQPFPKKWRTNLAGGAGIMVGYRLLPQLDLTIGANYDYLGTAITGITCHCIPGSPGEHGRNYLASKLQTIAVLAGFRFRF